MDALCIYCGKPIGRKPQILWEGKDKKEKLNCCCAACYNDTRRFIQWDKSARTKASLWMAVCVVINLILIGREAEVWWKYVPLMVIGACLCKWPLIFSHYHTYERYGIVKTLKYVRIAGGLIIAAGILFTVYA